MILKIKRTIVKHAKIEVESIHQGLQIIHNNESSLSWDIVGWNDEVILGNEDLGEPLRNKEERRQ